ncbi:hypothetical protein ADM99_15400 [Leptolinea tardivitalis]|uniref:DUF2992 domain-containing protein n=2 Tax=Leptolinea tardivitalis TaxID=229920 RepID=A0A0P6WPQ7_9CHLR|nr:hypothetical protein ADM99_15400 [Leptolinea tardivitalis]
MEGKLTVYFDPPYWVGIFEKTENGLYQTAKHVFGAEPSEPELLKFVLEKYPSVAFSRPVPAENVLTEKVNYKRRMREIRAEMRNPCRSTRAQEALQKEYEINARERKLISKEERQLENDHKYRLRQVRRAEKHRGH